MNFEELKKQVLQYPREVDWNLKAIDRSDLPDEQKNELRLMINQPKFKDYLEKTLFPALETGDIIGKSSAADAGSFGPAASIFEKITQKSVITPSGKRGVISFGHVGIIDVRKGMFGKRKIIVIEAGGGAKGSMVYLTPIMDWLKACQGKFTITRYNKGLSDTQKNTMMKVARNWARLKIPYDFGLNPGIDALYCSELVDEAYKSIGIYLVPAGRYLSLNEAEKRLGTFNRIERSTENVHEQLSKVVGPTGFYKDADLSQRNRRNMISPSDIIINENTRQIFNNMLD